MFTPPPTPPLKGKDASTEQSVGGPEAKAQPSMASLATKEETRPKVLIRGQWRKVPSDGYPKDASSQLERDQQFINELAKQLVAELCIDAKSDLIRRRALLHVVYPFRFSMFSLVYQWWSVYACYYIGPIPMPWGPIMEALMLANAHFTTLFLRVILFPAPAH